MRHNRMFCFVVLAASFFVSPITNAPAVAQCTSASKAKPQGHDHSGTSCDPHFSYARQDLWGGECRTGKEQSPINISNAERVPLTPLDFSGYRPGGLAVFNDCNHYRIQELVAQGVETSTIRYAGRTYKLTEFHFHEPAEDTVDSSSPFAMEVHLVHETVHDPKLKLVIAVMVRPGADKSLINTLWQ